MTASQGESHSVCYRQLTPKVDTDYTGRNEAEIPQYHPNDIDYIVQTMQVISAGRHRLYRLDDIDYILRMI